MKRYKLRFVVGPYSDQMSEKFSSAGIEVLCVGTEHLFLAEYGEDSIEAALVVIGKLKTHFGSTLGFSIRDLRGAFDITERQEATL